MIKAEIITLFINSNTKFTHLYIPRMHNCLIPRTNHLFSGLVFLNCSTATDKDVLSLLKRICQSIKELDLTIEKSKNNPAGIAGIVRLIEGQKKLIKVNFNVINVKNSELSCKVLENSLVKHANTIQHFRITKPPVTKILSSFVNLKCLELDNFFIEKWNCLEDLSLPLLQNLRASRVPINALTNLIKNTDGHLTEIKIDYVSHNNKIENKNIIRAIHQNCPNLKYLKLTIRNDNILELEKLLIICKHLNGLVILIDNTDVLFGWDNLFKILINSSPIGLFKFKFWLDSPNRTIDLESLRFFFDNWKKRPSMLLQIIQMMRNENIDNLIKKYKAEGIVAKYDNDYDYDHWNGSSLDNFEWV
ncbi:hypothetical protein GLOIN_2v113493 [Rhizophagus clarus]|nr:hypothetical protein GLOIN_2v113493 [Rhizophagus clarus]